MNGNLNTDAPTKRKYKIPTIHTLFPNSPWLCNKKIHFNRRSKLTLSHHKQLFNRRLIRNLSTKSLSTHETNILSLGLSFVPTAKNDATTLRHDIQRFIHTINRQHFFKSNEILRQPIHPFHTPSTWTAPPTNEASLTRFIQNLSTFTEQTITKPPPSRR